MGFYHHLSVLLKTGEQVEIGGYSKGGSLPHWYLAFSPTEYINNLEQVRHVNEFNRIRVGYKTTVAKAIERLESYQKQLQPLRWEILTEEAEKQHHTLQFPIDELLYELRKFSKDEALILNQTDGSAYSLIMAEDGVHVKGLQWFWYQNTASENAKIIKDLFSSVITLEEKVFQGENVLPDKEIPNFYQELQYYVPHHERGYGPHVGTELFENRPQGPLDNNLFQLFKTTLQEVKKVPNITGYDQVQACYIIHNMIEEVLSYSKKEIH